MNSLDRRKWLIVAAALCVSVFFADRFVLTPLFVRWETRAKRIAELEDLMEKAHSLVDRRNLLDERWRDMTEGDLPQRETDAEGLLLKSVSDWAANSGLEVTALKPRWSHDAEEAASLECRASVLGSIRQVTQFLYELETGPLAVKVEELTLNANDERGNRLGINLRFTGVILRESGE